MFSLQVTISLCVHGFIMTSPLFKPTFFYYFTSTSVLKKLLINIVKVEAEV